ncbi:MAG: heavy metal translocating P-type ATPase [Sphaerochaetaceae bacterium]|nr:heavy metal translocating P-type ATPase [Sphaerochaetaceae bacterium]
MKTVQIQVEGMTCASCVAHVEKGIKSGAGIDMAAVNLATEKATVSFDPSVTNLEDIMGHIQGAGYGAHLASDDEQDKKKAQMLTLRNETIVSAVLSAPLVLAMLAGVFSLEALMFLHTPILQFGLATPVQFYIGRRFFRTAWKTLRAGNPGMDVLVALGTSAAYLFSVFNAFFAVSLGIDSTGLYFEASAVIITLVLFGKYLEEMAKGKTSEAIRHLMDLQPKTAHVRRKGEELDLPLSDIVEGDIVLIRPGERIPVDGIVIHGVSAVDESALTGESMPVEKNEGESVLSGSLNSYGALEVEAKHAGKDSVFSRIIQIVEEAQSSKSPIQELADKVAGVFVPSVLVIALLTFLIWTFALSDVTQGIISAVAVLVIACPCALGLATPTAIMVSTGVGAQRGILIRNGKVLQQMEKIDTIVFDKTGTITKGKPEVNGLHLLADQKEEDILAVLASLENTSEHPLGKAIVSYVKERGVSPVVLSEFTAVPGRGIRGVYEGMEYLVGTERFMQENDLLDDSFTGTKAALEEEGNTVMILASSTEILALVSVSDMIKDSSPISIGALKKLGMMVYMITGDNRRTAGAIGRQAGIDHVLSEVLPEGKADKIAELKKSGRIVAMVGDGVNDAPALATADIGIAMAEGSDIAMEASDITLMRSDLAEVPVALELSKKTMNKIRQNLFWAFFYNALGIPFAALGLLNPMIAGAAMAFSSVSVVSNSLSLKRFKHTERTHHTKKTSAEAERTDRGEHSMTISVEGMSCNHCRMAVERSLTALDGVERAEVSLEKKNVSVTFARGKEDEGAARAAISEAGYTPV